MLTIKDVQIIVAEEYGLTMKEMLGVRRGKKFAEPRMIAMWLAYEILPNKSLPQIGRAFDRDHTTVLHACNRWKYIVGYSFDHIHTVNRIIERLRIKANLNGTTLP
jgi:chromosomal replication initiator protein